MCRMKQKQTRRYRLRVEPGVRQGFPSAWPPSSPCQGQGQVPHCWRRSPGELIQFALGVCSSCTQQLLDPEGSSAGARGAGGGIAQGSWHRPLQSDHHQKSKLSLMDDPCNRPWSWQHSLWCWSVCLAQAGPDTSLVSGTSQITHLVLTYPFCTASGASKCSPQAEFRHPLGHQTTKGACLHFVRPQSPICGSNSSLTREGLH